MAKNKRQRPKQRVAEPPKIEIVPPKEMSEEALTKVIANALIEYDRQREQAAQEKKRAEEETEKLALGKNKLLKLIFTPKKYVRGVQANSELAKTVLKCFYKLIEWMLLLFSILLVACIPLQFVIPSVPIVAWQIDIIMFVLAIPIFLFSRIFRIASIEIEQIKDYNYLFGLFATVTSIISVVIAIIAIIK